MSLQCRVAKRRNVLLHILNIRLRVHIDAGSMNNCKSQLGRKLSDPPKIYYLYDINMNMYAHYYTLTTVNYSIFIKSISSITVPYYDNVFKTQHGIQGYQFLIVTKDLYKNIGLYMVLSILNKLRQVKHVMFFIACRFISLNMIGVYMSWWCAIRFQKFHSIPVQGLHVKSCLNHCLKRGRGHGGWWWLRTNSVKSNANPPYLSTY